MIPNFVFLQGYCAAETPSKKSMNYTGENIEDADAKHLSFEEVNADYNHETSGSNEDHLQSESIADIPANLDILTDSLRSLQSLQEALITEVNKFGEISTQDLESEMDEASSSEITRLTQKVKDLEFKLIEADTNLKLKNSMIITLKDSLNSANTESAVPANEMPLQKLIELQLVAQEMTKLESKTCKLTSFFFIQLLLLASMAMVLIRQLNPHPIGIAVPT